MFHIFRGKSKDIFMVAMIFCIITGCGTLLKSKNLMILENFDENVELSVKYLGKHKHLIVVSLGITNPDIHQEDLTFEFVGLERLGTRFESLETKDEYTWDVIDEKIEDRVYLFYVIEPFERIQIKEDEYLSRNGKMQFVHPIQIKVSDGKNELILNPSVIATLV